MVYVEWGIRGTGGLTNLMFWVGEHTEALTAGDLVADHLAQVLLCEDEAAGTMVVCLDGKLDCVGWTLRVCRATFLGGGLSSLKPGFSTG